MIPIADERTSVETQIVEWADRVIAATPAEESQLVWLYGARQEKIVVVPPGVNTERFRPIPQAQAKAALGISPESNLLLFVGRIEPLKAVDVILEAIALLKNNAKSLLANTHFAIIGGDPDNPGDSELSRLIRLSWELDLSHIVTFLGAKAQSLLPNYYAAATAVIMPSDYESFGMVALEAMASGAPVIGTQVGGLAHLVRNGETGFLVPVRNSAALAERMAILLADPNKRDELGANAAKVAQEYRWSKIVDQLVAVLDEVAQNHPISRLNRGKNGNSN
jgi:D-inositol-3-phosphate glycosyltransferase